MTTSRRQLVLVLATVAVASVSFELGRISLAHAPPPTPALAPSPGVHVEGQRDPGAELQDELMYDPNTRTYSGG